MEDKELYSEDAGNDLYLRIITGDEQAFRRVHYTCKGRLLYFAHRLTNNWGEAEDIVAEAFFALWKHRKQIQSDKHLQNFLFLAVRNKAADFAASRERRAQLLNEMPDPIAFEEDLYDLKMMEEQMLYLLNQAVATLPTECARVFELAWRDERSPAEISRILGMNPATVRSQKRRAIELIRAWIKRNTPAALMILAASFTLYTFFRKISVFFCTMCLLIRNY